MLLMKTPTAEKSKTMKRKFKLSIVIRKLIKPCFILILGISLFACKKNNSTNRGVNVHSTLYDINSKTPKAGVKVYLSECDIPSVGINGNWGEVIPASMYYHHFIDSTITNDNGQFNFVYYPRLNANAVYTTPHYRIFDDLLFQTYTRNVEYCDDSDKDSIFVDRKRYLTIDMQKTGPVFADDSLIRNIQILQPLWDLWLYGDHFIGTIPQVKFFYSHPACTKVVVEWSYFHPNLQSSGSDTFDLSPNGTDIIVHY